MNASARNMHNREAIKSVVDISKAALGLTGTKPGIHHSSGDAFIDGEGRLAVALAVDSKSVSACYP
jgi:hypothetical protein